MKEKELRLALVCYGGASLAVYMHGVTKEILKLVRASAAFHAVPAVSERPTKIYQDVAPPRIDTVDTEAVYFELLKLISEHIDLRVIVDIVAGASAGGINGVSLSRALAHDLDIDPVTDAWMNESDVEFMMTETVRAKAWSKAVLRPIIHTISKFGLDDVAPDEEMRRKMSMFLRSRWFKPPFDGPTISDMFFRSLDKMDQGISENRSLLPAGQQLHLFVTVTDFFGHQQHLRLHDPKMICEKEHRLVLQFDYHGTSGGVISDFDRDHLPGLIFAARATSSYPGAFPPATLTEIERLLDQNSRAWPGRARFITKNFSTYSRQGVDLETCYFVDGGVLNNKPFSAAVAAIKNQNAFRDVDRRLIYIDPEPDSAKFSEGSEMPKFIPTLFGSLSSLPRSQPIRDDLAFVGGYNDRIRRVKLMMESAAPRINIAISALTDEAADAGPAAIQNARMKAHRAVVSEVGLFYDGYLALKIDNTVDYVHELVTTALHIKPESMECHALTDLFRLWAETRRITHRKTQGPAQRGENPAWLKFLDCFDLGFRDRRIRFVIRSLNQLYPKLGNTIPDVTATELNALKRSLYQILDTIQPFQQGHFVDSETRVLMETLATNATRLAPEDNLAAIDTIIGKLSSQMSLDLTCAAVEDLLCRNEGATACREVRRELLRAYVGYAYWDILTFSITNWKNIGEFDEIRVDRISPIDATSIDGNRSLKSSNFEGFAGFFSRTARESDYLSGRLHGVERLIDIVCSAMPEKDCEKRSKDIAALKEAAFRAILQSERSKLTAIEEEFDQFEKDLAEKRTNEDPHKHL